MKRIFLAMMMLVAVAVCVSCNGHSTDSGNSNNMVAGLETMELIEKGEHHEIWRDTKTGQEYFVRINGTGVCGFQLTNRESK